MGGGDASLTLRLPKRPAGAGGAGGGAGAAAGGAGAPPPNSSSSDGAPTRARRGGLAAELVERRRRRGRLREAAEQVGLRRRRRRRARRRGRRAARDAERREHAPRLLAQRQIRRGLEPLEVVGDLGEVAEVVLAAVRAAQRLDDGAGLGPRLPGLRVVQLLEQRRPDGVGVERRCTFNEGLELVGAAARARAGATQILHQVSLVRAVRRGAARAARR